MVTPENVSGGEGLSLQCTCLASLRLWFCLFCLHSRSRSSWTSFLELLSPRQSQTAQGAQCLEEAIHLILESSSIDSLKACGTDLYTTPHLLPMPRPLSPTFRPPKKKTKHAPCVKSVLPDLKNYFKPATYDNFTTPLWCELGRFFLFPTFPLPDIPSYLESCVAWR